jgi:hypothetical protein
MTARAAQAVAADSTATALHSQAADAADTAVSNAARASGAAARLVAGER